VTAVDDMNVPSCREGGCAAGVPVAAGAPAFGFYRDSYGGTLDAEGYAEALPAATRCVRALCGGLGPDGIADAADLLAWARAVCAAAEAFAEFGEGRVGGYSIGDFKVTNYMEKGTTGLEVARSAALAELAGTGLAFSGAGR
jgi:hypothetical protein